MNSQDMKKPITSLGGKGVESAFTSFKLKRRLFLASTAFGLFGVSIVLGLWSSAVSETTHSLVWNNVTKSGDASAVEWTIKCRLNDWRNSSNFRCGSTEDPDEFVDTVITLPGDKTLLTKKEYQKFIDEKVLKAGYTWYQPSPLAFFDFLLLCVSPLVFVFLFTIAFRWFVRYGKDETSNKRLDGVFNLVSGKRLTDQVKRSKGGDCGWTIADVALPAKSMVKGVGINGAQGSGKSLVVHDLIVQAKKKKVRLFINDPAGEFWQAHGDPANGDVYVNPALLGGVCWSIFSELVYKYDADVLANAFLPKKEGKGAGEFFDDASRSLFSTLLLRLAEMGAVNTSDIAKAFFELSEEELSALVAGTAAEQAVSVDAKGMRAGVMASAAIHMSGLAMMGEGSWCFQDFLDQPHGNIYFVGSEPKFQAVKRLMITTAFEVIKEKNIKHRDIKYFFILDEYPLLLDCAIDVHLAEKRKFGCGVLICTQNLMQLETMMGKPRASTTMGVIGTMLQLNCPDPDGQELASKRFGSQDMLMIAESQTLAIAESKDSLGINKTQTPNRPLLSPAKFGMLSELTGYLQVVGGFPSAKVDFQSWIEKGSSHDQKGTKADEISTAFQSYPAKDPRFLLKVVECGSWQQGVQIDVLKSQIESLKAQIPRMSQEAAKLKKMAVLASLEKQYLKLSAISNGEMTDVSDLAEVSAPEHADQKFAIDPVDDFDVGDVTGHTQDDEDELLI